MPAPYPKEFRDDVVAVARQGQAPLSQIAKDAIWDVWSNKIVGYSIDSRMKSSLARAALRSAIALRAPEGTVCHSDRGGQFRAKATQQLLANNGLIGSMGRSYGAGDNASIEMLLSVSSGHRRSLKNPEEVSGVVALQAPHRLPLRLALTEPTGDVVLGRLVVLGPREDHGVQSSVELAIAAA